jgi:hypothetical protein
MSESKMMAGMEEAPELYHGRGKSGRKHGKRGSKRKGRRKGGRK